jgi:RAD51-like protein 2
MEALDVRVLRSIPTPVADSLMARGCRKARDVLARPELLKDALSQLHVAEVDQKASTMLGACRAEIAGGAWGSADSALELLQRVQGQPPLALPCDGLGRLLGNALRPGAGILEVCGLPGTGKTQLCMQLCAATQIPFAADAGHGDALAFAGTVYVDAEGSFVPRRYAQMCRALLGERRQAFAHAGPAMLEQVLRNMHVCRTYDAAELYATVKNLGTFLKARPGHVRAIVVDSVAFCFRHELLDNVSQRSRTLTDIAATLRHYGAEHGLAVIVTNHMTTKFDRTADFEDNAGWLAPALGETWAHQPSTQLRMERTQQGAASGACQPLGRATLTKSAEQATGRSCLFQIVEAGLRDPPATSPQGMGAPHATGQWAAMAGEAIGGGP